ncbi:MAG: hypothetical protein J6Z34_05430 [Clostridia bacterium]|nr:hypothetical protein [Clostridia bacterium]
MKKRILTTFLAGILCFSLFTLAGCSINSGVVELYDSSVTIEFDNWHITSRPCFLITIKAFYKNATFECIADGSKFRDNYETGTEKIIVQSGEAFMWIPFDPRETGVCYIDIIKKQGENIVGYSIIKIVKNDRTGEDIPKVIKSKKLLKIGRQYITEDFVKMLIDKAKQY